MSFRVTVATVAEITGNALRVHCRGVPSAVYRFSQNRIQYGARDMTPSLPSVSKERRGRGGGGRKAQTVPARTAEVRSLFVDAGKVIISRRDA